MTETEYDTIEHALKALDFRVRLLQSSRVNLEQNIDWVRDGFEKLRAAIREDREKKNAPNGAR